MAYLPEGPAGAAPAHSRSIVAASATRVVPASPPLISAATKWAMSSALDAMNPAGAMSSRNSGAWASASPNVRRCAWPRPVALAVARLLVVWVIPSGPKTRSRMYASYDVPDTASMSRPSTM